MGSALTETLLRFNRRCARLERPAQAEIENHKQGGVITCERPPAATPADGVEASISGKIWAERRFHRRNRQSDEERESGA
jgi:hypothetical protein